MNCPRCDSKSIFTEYDYDKTKKKYVRKIYCPICYHREVFEITMEDSLEDYIDFRLYNYFKQVKKDVMNCFNSTDKIYHDGTLLDDGNKKVKVEITIREKW